MTYMSKIIYDNMGVKSFVKTSTIQHPAPKLSKVHLNTLHLEYKNCLISFDENQHQFK